MPECVEPFKIWHTISHLIKFDFMVHEQWSRRKEKKESSLNLQASRHKMSEWADGFKLKNFLVWFDDVTADRQILSLNILIVS